MKRLIKVILMAAAMLTLISFGVRAGESENAEYIITQDGEEYVLSVYSSGSPTPVMRSSDFNGINQYIAALSRADVIFGGITVNENIELTGGSHTFYGSLSMPGGAMLTVSGGNLTMRDFTLSLSGGSLRIKDGAVTLEESEINSIGASAVVLNYSAGARFIMNSGNIYSDSDSAAILLESGSAFIKGGSVKNQSGIAIQTSSTLLLSEKPDISGSGYDIIASSPITLSNGSSAFEAELNVKYLKSFAEGSIECVFYSASEKSIYGITLYDLSGAEQKVTYFESYTGIEERSFGAVYLPYKVNYYCDGTLINTENLTSGMLAGNISAPKKTGYDFLGWGVDDNGGALYDFAQSVDKSFDLYAKYKLLPPTFSVSSLEFTYDGLEHSFGISSLSHPLLENALVSYLWYRDGVPVADVGPILKIKSVKQSGSYSATVTFTYGTDTVSVSTPEVLVKVNKAKLELPSIAEKSYTGEYLTPDIYSTPYYTVAEAGGTVVGTYPVKITLTDPENCEFSSGGSIAYSDFSVTKAENFWTAELTVLDIYEGMATTPKAASRFGNVSYLYSTELDGVYTETAPSTSGRYYCIASVSETENYTSLTSEPIEFSVISEIATGISIFSMPNKTDYKAFDRFIADGLSLSVTFNSSRTEIIYADKISLTYQTADSFRYGDNAVIASYLDVSIAVPVSVGKMEYDISGILFSDSTVIFDGEKKSIAYTGALPMGLDGIPLGATVIGGGTNAGIYTVVLSFSTASKNYKAPASIEATLTVTPYESVVVFSDINFVYDGNLKCPEAYYTDVYGRKITLSVAGARSLAGEYTAVASGEDGNYKLIGASTVYKIAKADYDFSDLYWSCDSFTYDGSPKSVSVAGLPNGVTVVGYGDNEATEAGKYTAKATVIYDENNYNPPPQLIHEWVIERADYDLSVFSFEDAVYIYNGTEQFPMLSGTLPTGIDGISLTYSFSRGATHVSEGRVEVKISFATESKNYNIPDNMLAYVKIEPLGIGVIWNNFEFVYDTAQHAPTAIANECAVSVAGAMSDAGNYTATAISLNSDYYIVNPTVDFIIKKAENFWTTNISVKDIFAGREPSPYAECLGGDVRYVYYSSIGGTPLSAPPTSAGKYYVEAVTEGNGNYNPIKSEKIQFTVIEIVPISMSVVMNRSDFSAFDRVDSSDFTVTLQNNDGSYTKADPSSVNVSYSSAESLRYNDGYIKFSCLGFSVNVAVSVKKADYDMSGVRWSETEFIYDGTEKFITLLGLPDGVSVKAYNGSSGIVAGSYTATAILSYDSINYNPPSVNEGIFVIKKRTLDIPTLPTLIYNGKEQLPDILPSDLYTAEYGSGVHAGLYQVIFRITDPHNYAFSDSSSEAIAYYQISPREITVQLSDIEKYRLSSMPKPDYTVVDGEIVVGDELGLTFSYGDEEVSCISGNSDYLLTVIPGKITRHSSLSEDTVFLIFIIFLIVLTVSLLIFLLIFRRRDIIHYASVIKCRLSPVAKTAAPPPETEETAVPEELNAEAIDLTMSVDAEHADSLISDSLAKELVKREDVKIETSGTKKRIINVDTLSESFASGDSVDVNKLKEMSLVPYDTAYIKVLARGMIDKPLKVYANDFSLSAVKMIALTGGEAVRVITVRKKKEGSESKDDKFPENS